MEKNAEIEQLRRQVSKFSSATPHILASPTATTLTGGVEAAPLLTSTASLGDLAHFRQQTESAPIRGELTILEEARADVEFLKSKASRQKKRQKGKPSNAVDRKIEFCSIIVRRRTTEHGESLMDIE